VVFFETKNNFTCKVLECYLDTCVLDLTRVYGACNILLVLIRKYLSDAKIK
jgi:hypothetical protein